MATVKRVIIPLDGSELSERILPWVQALAKNLDLDVILLGLYGNPARAASAGEGFYNTAQLEAFVAELRAETSGYLAGKAEEMKRAGFEKVSVVVKEGLTADEIMAFARQTPDSLVAMCTHGRSGVKRWMLGSVTETVVRHSGAPVLVLRPS
jgi:nucleotide-binding universal stress UspA family protein